MYRPLGSGDVDFAAIVGHLTRRDYRGWYVLEDQLTDLLAGASVVLDDDVLDRIDQIVPPGVTLNPADAGWQPPALTDPAARRPPAPRAKRSVFSWSSPLEALGTKTLLRRLLGEAQAN